MDVRGTLALAAIVCAMCGCAAKVRDSTSVGEPVVSPDTTSTAIGIVFMYRPPFLPPVDRTFEIHTYDLAHRRGPRRLLRWVLDRDTWPRIVGWDDAGLIVTRGDAKPPVRIDPVSGALKPLPAMEARSLEEESASRNTLDLHRTHVELRSEGYFLWNLRAREYEFLFPMPVEPGEMPPSASSMAARERHSDTVHRIWEVSARQESGSTRFRIETYVPRPGKGSRLYLLSLFVEQPDTSGQHFFDDRFVPFAAREVLLGPSATTQYLRAPNRELQRSMTSYRSWLRRDIGHGSIPLRIKIQLRPILIPGEEDRLPLGFRVASREDVDISIPAPAEWIAEARIGL